MLQHLGNSALWTLLDIFNLSWRQGKVVSQCWKEAIMMHNIKERKEQVKSLELSSNKPD
jgi:hypothetical protein